MNISTDAVAIAGSGPVAQALGRLLYDRGVPVTAVASRTVPHAARAAAYIGQDVHAVTYAQLPGMAPRIVIAVTDAAIPEVARLIAAGQAHGAVAIHTCGAQGPDVLAALGDRGYACGVLHPLQTVPTREHGVRDLPGVRYGVGGDPAATEWAEELVARLGGTPLRIRPNAFPLYHAGAVLAGNGAFALVEAAVGLLVDAGLERTAALEALAPLCRRSLENALTTGPATLTGPVGRGDAGTIRAHTDALASAAPHIAALYRATGLALVEIARTNGLREQALHELEDALTA